MKVKITRMAASAIVIANMIGTGVFTSLGFQLEAVKNTWSIIILWSIGAVMALSGAFSYAELGTKMTRSGGEYHYLSKIYHPLLGYLSGWTSITVGFAAPIALAAMAAGAYTQRYLGISATWIATLLIVGISVLHMFHVKKSAQFQNITTLIKVSVIFCFLIIGWITSNHDTAFEWSSNWQKELILPSFAVSLVYVSYSFSGWNAAAYIVDEIEKPQENLPKALIGGTLLVSVLYVLLQITFLKQVPLKGLVGQLEIGQIVAISLFGTVGGTIVSGLIAFMLISSISAMVWVGPRVTKALAEDYQLWKPFQKTNLHGIPNRAIILQACLALLMIYTGSFDQILTYSAFILQIFVALTVFSVFKVRKNTTLKGYKSPGFPIPQLLFLCFSAWILLYLLIDQPLACLIGLGILLLGVISYAINQNLTPFKKGIIHIKTLLLDTFLTRRK